MPVSNTISMSSVNPDWLSPKNTSQADATTANEPTSVTAMPTSLQRPTVVVVNVQPQDPTLLPRITSLEAERNRLETERVRLVEERAKLSGEKFSVLSTLASQEEQLAQSRAESSESRASLQQSTTALQEQTLRAKTLELENESLQKQLQALSEEAQSKKQQKSIEEEQRALLLTRLENVQRELSSTRETLQTTVAKQNKETQEQEVRYQKLFAQNTALLHTVTTVTQEKDSLQKRIQEMHTILERCRTTFLQKTKEMQHVTEELAQARKEAESSRNQIDQQQATLTTTQANLARNITEKEALAQQLRQKINEVETIGNLAHIKLQEAQQQMTTFVQGKMQSAQAAVQQAQGAAQKSEETRRTLVENASREIARKLEQIASLQLQLENETAQKRKAEEKAQTLQQQLSRAASTSPSLSSRALAQENAQLKHRVEELTSQIKNHTVTQTLAHSLNTAQKQQLQKQENELIQLRAREHEGTTERTHLQERLNQALKRLESTELASAVIQQERLRQAQEIETLRRKLATQAEEVRKQEEQSAAEKNQLLVRINKLEGQLTRAVNEKCAIQKVLKDIERTIAQERQNNEAQNGTLSSKNNILERELSEAQTALRQQQQLVEREHAQAQQAITQIRREREAYIENLQKRLVTAETIALQLEARLKTYRSKI